ncbi:Swt21p SCDLUD_002979 [Saccharomycodes ludwigii]|uniref:Swt21p n=1 Tax=Saccharomycodes ludwigii TaxID=36035 RepID=UPI001E834700|nr:hypothetical protein SCDLUD_002979 [Saccharomycodes ludwigii]KAH3901484.1 hypothetical protein SCDLUD_002979 [Saccharomycodes ludwigii]
MYASTDSLFYGNSIDKILQKEYYEWYKLTKKYPDYTFPKLSRTTNNAFLINRSCCDTLQSLPVVCTDAQWCFDGTGTVTFHNDYGVRLYLVPEDGGKNKNKNNAKIKAPKILVPFYRWFKPHSIITGVIHPKLSLYVDSENNNTHTNKLVILSHKNLPLQLHKINYCEEERITSLFNYSTENPTNEKYETVYSLSFISDFQFLSGSVKDKIALYDLNYKDPIVTWKPNNHNISKSTIVTCFSDYDDYHIKEQRMNNAVLFGDNKNRIYRIDLRSKQNNNQSTDLVYSDALNHGNGISQILSSANGHYQYILKRKSNKIDVLDLRGGINVNYVINSFQISPNEPCMGKSYKVRGCINNKYGLLIGSNYRKVIYNNWNHDFIEFGGIDRDGNVHSYTEDNLETIINYHENVSEGDVMTNIVKSNPIDPDQLFISYTPRICSNSADDINNVVPCKSGLGYFNI